MNTIPWALVNGKMKSIEQIKDVDKGEVICPKCKEKLLLKAINSDVMVKHLAHYPNSKCPFKNGNKANINGVNESFEHLYVKQFLKDNLSYFREKNIILEIVNDELKLTGYRDINIKEIHLEKMLVDGYKPDLTIISDTGKTICLEIYKTNKKDIHKIKEKIGLLPISIYEVDINNMQQVTIPNIFKNMELIHSDIKSAKDIAVSKINDLIIENIKLLKDKRNNEDFIRQNKNRLQRIELQEYKINTLKDKMKSYREENFELKSKVCRLQDKIKSITCYGDIERMIFSINMLKLRLNEIDYDVKTGQFQEK